MAATLAKGLDYGLASNVSSNDKKTFVHFKLTDSALRAIEEYFKIKTRCSQKPSIQFANNSGVMSIPGQASSQGPQAERSFQLSVANIPEGIGSLDCIQQTNTRQSSGLQCLGSMHFKVNTLANNDVYTDTRKKIAIADNESKKSCAKEIKMSSRFKGKMMKKVIANSQYKALMTTKATPSPTTRPINTRVTPPPSRSVSPHQVTCAGRGTSKPASNTAAGNGLVKLGPSPGTKQFVVSMPYRERVIHLLALRPYKKPELLAKLTKDGIREKDRNSLGAVLKSIAVMNKDNSFSLAKHAWQEVRNDWPFYDDTERLIMKKSRQEQESRRSVSPSPALAGHAPDCPSPPLKRTSDDFPDYPTKKQRIAHQTRTLNKVLNSDLMATNSRHYKASMSLAAKAAGDKTAADSSSYSENHGKGDGSSAKADFKTQYTEIENCDQRKCYKEDFNTGYEEYQRLHERVQRVTRQFEQLKERILNTKEGTQDFEELYSKVMQEYEKHKNNTQFWQDKHRLSYLHGKLGHIKQLVADFDKNRLMRECS